MQSFYIGHRIRVTDPESRLHSRTGTVVAWVNMDGDIPDRERTYRGQDDSRRNWVMAKPEACEEV